MPTVTGPLRRRDSVHAVEALIARTHTTRRLKFTLPGPMTIADTIADAHYGDRAALAMAFAEVLNEEARDLAALGVDVIQFDEPAFNVYLDEVVGWGIEALHRAAADLPCRTAVHICYGYGIPANIEWKRGLGREWRQYERIFPALAASHIDQVSLECANSHVPIELLALLAGKDVLVGAIDVASDEAETPEAGRRDDRSGAALCAARAAVSLHELRHGAARPHAGEPETRRACRRRRAGARPLGFHSRPRPGHEP